MAEESINTSVASETIEPDGGNLRRSSMGKPGSPNGGPNKLPDYRRASVGSYRYESNSRRNATREPTTPANGQNILPHHVRASTGSFRDVANLRRNSTGKSSSPNSGESVAPHYLRASTGSCHDFCKYGRKHAFEVKARRPIPRRVITPPSHRLSIEFGVPAERNTTTVVKPKPSPVSKTLSPDSANIIKKEVSSPSEKVEVSLRQASSSEKKIAQNQKKNNFPGKHTPVKPKSMIVKPLSSSDTSGGLNGIRNREIKMAKRTTSKAAVNKIHASPGASLSPKPSINRVVSLKYRSLKLVSPLKDQNRIRKAKQPNSENVPEKTLHVIRVETESKVLESTQNDSTIHYSLSPTLSSPKSSSLPKPPAPSFHEEEVQEYSEYTDSEVDEADDSISESSETANLLKIETSEGNHKKTPRIAVVGLSDDKDCAPAKLKFKRGKVIDLLAENSGPRRLRFRRGRVLGENQDGKAEGRKRSFKKRGVEDDTNGTDPGSEKVVLRHQDVQGKKDAQGLFNNVIEETASKLVESRKSKVKALVGAFETVISLQESKPSP